MKDTMEGKVWRFGDHVDTDQIIPAERLLSQYNERLGEFLFEKARPGMVQKVAKGDIVVAGRNFGCGSSREHAPRALKQAGIACIVAESYARIFYRNSINVGLLPIECKIEADEGDVLIVDIKKGMITNKTSGGNWRFKPFPPFIKDLVDKGGLMAKVKEDKRCSK
ncbi:MAG TPA: 3-isopropylmalate dehydratase [Methanomassiliicoccales archaeon]|jgi:3-isopropylmalate dehydratase small subunit|nr:3-isopropylmalate dehydratase [Methanomassiliicoccales archaeon]